MTVILEHFKEIGFGLEAFPVVAFYVMLFIMALDIITGLLKALYHKTANSKYTYKGFIKKLSILAGIGLAVLLDLILSGGIAVISTGAIMLMVVMEGMSVLENLGSMGINFPFISKRLQQILDKQTDKDEKD